eukprot:Phypoly_transcript_01392.p1 GENE.Phypoly_transcript_01392~~Phypoly_transcript_01392.p1  ORF type:complete len:855 (-),score=140.50 Phypoly_transcript_01392:868-3168(-)
MAYNLLFLFGKLIQKIFFGNLRDAEIQNLSDRLLTYVLFKIVFVGAVMEPDLKELLIWTSWFSILGFLKIFTLLTRDRFEYLNTFSPHTHPTIHVRMLTLLVLILFSDLAWFALCVKLFFEAGISVLLLLNFECFTIYMDTVQTLVKYAIHLLDLARSPTDGVWEQRGQYIYYTEFATDSFVLAGTLGHYMHILYLHGLSVTLLDAVLFMHMRIVFNNLRVKIIAYRNYRQLAENMNHRYPSVSAEDLQQYNDDCAICREVMVSAKKLPCGHIFHHSCLRSWLEQHHSCPTCRHSLIDQPQQQQAQQAQQPQQPQQPHPAMPTMTMQFQQPFIPQGHLPRNDQLPPNIPGPHDLPMHPGGNQNPNQNHPLLRFSSDRWLGWLPSFSVEVVRRQGMLGMHPHHPAWGFPAPPEMVRAVQEIFPSIPPNVIAQDLAITHSVEQTTENILEGRVTVPPAGSVNILPPTPYPSPAQPSPVIPDTQPPRNIDMQPPRSSEAQDPSDHYNTNTNINTNPINTIPINTNNNTTTTTTSTASSDNNNNNTETSASTGPSGLPSALTKYSDTFASSAQDRKQSLQARKQAMLEAARKHFLESKSPATQDTPQTHPPPHSHPSPLSHSHPHPSPQPHHSVPPPRPHSPPQPHSLPHTFIQPHSPPQSPAISHPPAHPSPHPSTPPQPRPLSPSSSSSSSLPPPSSSLPPPSSSSSPSSPQPIPLSPPQSTSPTNPLPKPQDQEPSPVERRRLLLEAAQRRHSATSHNNTSSSSSSS